MRAFRNVVLAAALCGAGAGSVAYAQNLLPNAGFNTDISGWTANYSNFIALSWSPLDARGSSGSGSLLITDSDAGDTHGISVFGICVPVVAGQKYHAGASFYFPGGQSHDAQFAVLIQFTSSSDCRTGIISSSWSPVLSPAEDTWQRLDTQPAVAPVGAIRAFALFGLRKIGGGDSMVGNVDDVVFESSGSNLCYPSDEQLCLAARFSVKTHWVTGSTSGDGHALALVADTGAFWFFSPTNLEMLVKALDGCAVNQKKWIFAGGLTNVNVTTTVTDLSTGGQKIYTNPANHAFQPVQDTAAFSTCP